jgi:hypothetical protein
MAAIKGSHHDPVMALALANLAASQSGLGDIIVL